MTSLRPKVLALGTFAAYRNHDVCLDAHTMLTSLSCYHATSKYLTGTMLDGGGVRGWTQILLLERITREIKSLLEKVEKDQIREEDLYPSEYFDLIVGTATGGIIAICVGRLGMSISQLKKAYDSMGDKVFRNIIELTSNDGNIVKPLFDTERLEAWAKQLALEYTGDENAKIMPHPKSGFGNINNRGCKVGVTGLMEMNLTFPAVFRSYKGRDTPNCTIWEAIRITTADPQLFYPIYIMKTTEKETVARTERYISAEFGHNNPIRLLIHEAEQVFRSWPVYACVVSIGTGRSMNESFSLKDIPKDEPQRLHGVFMRMVKDTERDHQEFGLAIQDDGDKDYFRFNVDEGILDGWSYDWTQKEHFIKATERYLSREEHDDQFVELAENYKPVV